MWPVRRANKPTTVVCGLYRNLEASTFRNPLWAVTGMYRDCITFTFTNNVRRNASGYGRCECGAGKDMAWAVAYFKYYRSTTEAGNCTSFGIILFKAVPRLRPGFNPRPIHVRFVVDKVALGQVFLQVLRFPPSVPFILTHFVTDATKS